jgi:hypothetical protein
MSNYGMIYEQMSTLKEALQLARDYVKDKALSEDSEGSSKAAEDLVKIDAALNFAKPPPRRN